MTDTDIVTRLAREASATGDCHELSGDALYRFAALVAEECAKLVEGHKERDPDDDTNDSYWAAGANSACEFAARDIRAKFKA